MKKIDRRNLLVQGGLSAAGGALAAQLPPIDHLLKIMGNHIIRRAGADDSPPMNYISFNMPGAPARWCFDQFLKTRANQTIISNPYVTTRFSLSSSTYGAGEYAVVDFKGVQVPALWNSQVTGRNGGRRALNELLKHMIVMRGYGTGVDGHPSNHARQTNPVASAGSVGGHMADGSAALFRALHFPPMGTFSGFSSVQGTGLSTLFYAGKANYAERLLTPFSSRQEAVNLVALQRRYADDVDQIHRQIRSLMSQKYGGLSVLDVDFSNSLKTLKEGVGDLSSSWNSLYAKYEAIVLNTIKDRTVQGLSDRPVVAQASTAWQINRADAVVIQPNPGTDLRDWYNNVDCTILISAFALAEFVITRGYGRAMEFSNLGPSNLVGYFDGSSSPVAFQPTFDQHRTGVSAMTFVNGTFFRALGAGLIELVNVLKETGEFGRTVIHLVQEFGRTPRQDGSGSDHGFDAMITSVLTGALDDKPLVIGNICQSGGGVDTSVYAGTFGQKAATVVSGSTTDLTPAHVTSSLAVLLNFPRNPWANVAVPLLSLQNGRLQALAGGEIV